MVRRVTAEHEVELAVGEWQAFGGAAYGADVIQAAIHSGGTDHVEHLLGQIVGDHSFDQRRYLETHMTGTAAQVQQSCRALPGQFGLEQREFGALGVHRTAQVRRGLLAELFLHDLGVDGAGHGELP